MPDLTDIAAAITAVRDPRTSPADLTAIGSYHPQLRPLAAAHPNATEAMRVWLAQASLPATAPAPATPVYAGAPHLASARQLHAGQPAPTSHSRGLIILVIVMALILFASAIALLISRSEPSSHPGPIGVADSSTSGPADTSDVYAWARTQGGATHARATDVATAPDGTIVVVGAAAHTSGGAADGTAPGDSWVTKYDADGTVLWSNTIPGDDVWLTSVGTTANGQIIAAGTARNTGDRGTHAERGCDGIVVSLSAEGAVEWSRTIGGSDEDHIMGAAVTEAGIIVVGETMSDDGPFPRVQGRGGAELDAFVARLALSGDLVWGTAIGGTGADTFWDAAVTLDGSIAVVGETTSTDGDFPSRHDVSQGDAVVAMLTWAGTLVWTATLGGDREDRFNGVDVTTTGTIIAVGSTNSTDGSFGPAMGEHARAAVAALAPDGSPTMAVSYDRGCPSSFQSVAILDDAMIVAVGGGCPPPAAGGVVNENGGDAFLVAFAPSGDLHRVIALGGSDWDHLIGVDVISPETKSVVSVGVTTSTDGDLPPAEPAGTETALVVRFAPL